MSNENVHDLLGYTGKHDKYSLVLLGGGSGFEGIINKFLFHFT